MGSVEDIPASPLANGLPIQPNEHNVSNSSSELGAFDDLKWITDIPESDCFTHFKDYLPPKSFDFGDNGYTASINHGHELLQLTAPDDKCGLVYVRGSFSNWPDAILARAQRYECGKSTFGLRLVVNNNMSLDYKIGTITDQGFLNFRWPYMEYSLETAGCIEGDASSFLFVKDGTVYQIMRFRPGRLKEAKDDNEESDGQGRAKDNLGPGTYGKEFIVDPQSVPGKERKLRIKIGGNLRMGCPCQNRRDPLIEEYEVKSNGCILTCTNARYDKQLDMQLFVNGEKVPMSVDDSVVRSEIEAGSEKDITLEPGKITIVVGTFSITDKTTTPNALASLPPSLALTKYLGLDETSPHATDLLWLNRIKLGVDDHSLKDLCSSAACLEQILSVTSLPLKFVGHRRPSLSSLSSASVTKTDPPDAPASFEVYDTVIGNQVGEFHLGEPRSLESHEDKTEGPQALNLAINASSGLAQSFDEDPFSHVEDTRENSTEEQPDAELALNQDKVMVDARDTVEDHPPTITLDKPQVSNSIRSRSAPFSVTINEVEPREPSMGIALLSNLMASQVVDLQHSFWQIRFLTKTHNFFAMKNNIPAVEDSTEPPTIERAESNPPQETDTLMNVQANYLERIKSHLHHALIWLATTRHTFSELSSPATEPYSNGSRSGCYLYTEDPDDTRLLYPPIAIWYVMKHCSEALPQSFLQTLLENFERLKNQYSGTMDLNKNDHPTKLVLLIWYSYSCLDKIYQSLSEIPGYEGTIPPRVINEVKKIAKSWQKKAENSIAITRKRPVESYSEAEESIDRLALLSTELGLVSTCKGQARRIIRARKETKVLNPGELNLAAPWELNCLNHHIQLALWDDPETEDDATNTARYRCTLFLTSSYSFVPTWNMSNPEIAALWWDTEASSVICATILDMRTKVNGDDKSKLDDELLEVSTAQKRRPSVANVVIDPESIDDKDESQKKGEPRPKKEVTDDVVVDLLRRQLENQDKIIQALTSKKENDTALNFNWIDCEPPSPFHPETWIQSLDDTPELYNSAQTKTVQLRNGIRQYLTSSRKAVSTTSVAVDPLAPPHWEVDKISEQFDFEELEFLSIFDISRHHDHIYYKNRAGRLSMTGFDYDDGTETQKFNFYYAGLQSNSYGPSAGQLALELWLSYLDGNLKDDQPVLKGDSLQRKYKSLAPTEKAALKDPDILLQVKTDLRNKLISLLTDSFLDLRVRHRIFFIQRCSPSIVKAFIYMWHTQSIDTFDNHFRDSSHFFDTKRDDWVTSVSLSYWGFKPKAKTTHGLFYEERDRAPFPPKKVALQKKVKRHWWHKDEAGTTETSEIEEGSSSLVISGDLAGNWWTCSIISSILSETEVNDCLTPIVETLKTFVHQPSTGRCLIFLALLGLLCDSLTGQYEPILKELTKAIKLGREVLKKGLDWEHEEDAIQRLKSMLWALEALRIFDDRLSDSLDKVKESKEKMVKYISQGPGRRHEQLEHQCQVLIEDFDKRYGNLVSIHVKIEQKIVQISRYREGISAVSNLEDTHTALKQNDTIRILTYITIAYLPVSFVAALWSVDLVSSNLGGAIFGTLLAVFLIATFVLARSLGAIMNGWDKLMNIIMKKLNPRSEQELDDMSDEDDEAEDEQLIPIKPGHETKGMTGYPVLHPRRRKQKMAPLLSFVAGAGRKKNYLRKEVR